MLKLKKNSCIDVIVFWTNSDYNIRMVVDGVKRSTVYFLKNSMP